MEKKMETTGIIGAIKGLYSRYYINPSMADIMGLLGGYWDLRQTSLRVRC